MGRRQRKKNNRRKKRASNVKSNTDANNADDDDEQDSDSECDETKTDSVKQTHKEETENPEKPTTQDIPQVNQSTELPNVWNYSVEGSVGYSKTETPPIDVGNQSEEAAERQLGYNVDEFPSLKRSDERCTERRQVNQIVHHVAAENIQIGNENVMKIQPVGTQTSTTLGTEQIEETICDSFNVKHEITVDKDTNKDHSQIIGKISATNVDISLNVYEQKDTGILRESTNKTNEFKIFIQAIKEFTDGHYILVVDTVANSKHVEAIALVPWLVVFDFDTKSRRSGLLSFTEEAFRTNLELFTWQDKCKLTDSGTSWISLKGTSERPDSLTEDDFLAWKQRTKKGTKQIIDELENFERCNTAYTIIVFWNGNNVRHTQTILDEIVTSVSTRPTIILVDDDRTNSKHADSTLEMMKMEYKDKMIHVHLSFEEMCTAIASVSHVKDEDDTSAYRLPNSNGTQIINLTDKEAKWIAVDLEVLYLKNMTGSQLTNEDLEREEVNFSKGGTLPWAWWYHVGAGHAEVERDILRQMKRFIIKKHIKVYKPGLITLCHNPGSGGTTLAQRILWELREEIPCAEVKHYSRSALDDVAEKIEKLYTITGHPVMLLMDGDDEQRVELVQRLFQDHRYCLIILYVKRYPYTISEKQLLGGSNNEGTFWLTGKVSKKEASILNLKHGCRGNDRTRKKAVAALVAGVEHGEVHTIFEFGLAMHNHEYEGIHTYVKSYLRVHENKTRDLQPWQQALGILSLAYYYGQTSIPSHFFSRMIPQASNRNALRFEDFPPEMAELIVQDKRYGRSEMVRISHFLVAKEILDQVLVPSLTHKRKKQQPHITREAMRNLSSFAINFIKYSGEKEWGRSFLIQKLMARIFISRDNRRAAESETHDTKGQKTPKPKVSLILENVSERAPYTERIDVLKELTKSFPQEAEFHAHLGRLYAIFLPEDHENAEHCFVTALEICEKQTSGQKPEDMPHHMRVTLMHIYHMYGHMMKLWMTPFTGKYMDTRPRYTTSKEKVPSTATRLLGYAKKACTHFNNCRDISPPGYEQAYNYTEEIYVRLMFCGFVSKRCGSKSLQEYIRSTNDENVQFVEECSEVLVDLFKEYISIVDQIDSTLSSLDKWHYHLFQNVKIASLTENVFNENEENMHTRRRKIDAIKMKYGSNMGLSANRGNKPTKEDIKYIVHEYEKNFADENQILTKTQNDMDYKDWLLIIRHTSFTETRYLKDVLNVVQKWYYSQNTSLAARFYLFVLKSLIGFGDGKYIPRNTEVLKEALALKDVMVHLPRFTIKPKYPKEFLGIPDPSIRRLVPMNQIGWLQEKNDDHPREIMIGTVCPPNEKPGAGQIDLDLGEDNRIAVKVFYVPVRENMKGKHHSNERVEFHLGFSISHGYEALNVKPLKSMKCQKCNGKIETKSSDTIITCPYRQCGERHDLRLASVHKRIAASD